MKLTVEERLVLLGLLPAEGDILTLRVMRDLRAALGFTEHELALAKFEQLGDSVRWDMSGALEIGEVDISIGARARTIIVGVLEHLDSEHKLRPEHISLCDKFEIGLVPERE